MGIDTFCGAINVPGLTRVEYLPTAWIDSDAYTKVVNSANNWQHAIPLLANGWLTAPMFPIGRLWDETQNDAPQGPSFQQSITGRTPALRPAVTGEFEEMSHYRYLLRLTDQNGHRWLLGELESPLTFSAKAATEPNAYNLTFSGRTPHRAYGYVPIF